MNRGLEEFNDKKELEIFEELEEQKRVEELDNMIQNKVDDIRSIANYKRTLTDKEKIELLKTFLDDDIGFKAMKDTFSEAELIHYINNNLDVMLKSSV